MQSGGSHKAPRTHNNNNWSRLFLPQTRTGLMQLPNTYVSFLCLNILMKPLGIRRKNALPFTFLMFQYKQFNFSFENKKKNALTLTFLIFQSKHFNERFEIKKIDVTLIFSPLKQWKYPHVLHRVYRHSANRTDRNAGSDSE